MERQSKRGIGKLCDLAVGFSKGCSQKVNGTTATTLQSRPCMPPRSQIGCSLPWLTVAGKKNSFDEKHRQEPETKNETTAICTNVVSFSLEVNLMANLRNFLRFGRGCSNLSRSMVQMKLLEQAHWCRCVHHRCWFVLDHESLCLFGRLRQTDRLGFWGRA